MIAVSSFRFFETYLAIAMIYWMMTLVYSLLQNLLERKLSKPYRS